MTIYFQSKKQKVRKQVKKKNLIKLMEEIFNYKKLRMKNQKKKLKTIKNENI